MIADHRNTFNRSLLGGLSPARFLARHWQKTPLLIRAGLPSFDGFLDVDDLFDLSCREDCHSRLISQRAGAWRVEHGPFELQRLRKLPRRGWTLLVQGVEQFLPQGRALLDRFCFIAYARLDDLMVSYAPPGGGVGPHFDHYDVFLLQGAGRRRWQVSHQRDLQLRQDAPLKILRQFRPQGECTLESGDLLYLPPCWAHDGVALDHCFTYSIGFRAPDYRQICHAFLAWLDDRVELDGRYADPHLRPTRFPGRLPAPMLADTQGLLRKLQWTEHQVRDFLGAYLSEPKSQAVFSPPQRPLSRPAFKQKLSHSQIKLALQSSLVYHGRNLFMNGEPLHCELRSAKIFAQLADQRTLHGAQVIARADAVDTAYGWYLAGYVYLFTASIRDSL